MSTKIFGDTKPSANTKMLATVKNDPYQIKMHQKKHQIKNLKQQQ